MSEQTPTETDAAEPMSPVGAELRAKNARKDRKANIIAGILTLCVVLCGIAFFYKLTNFAMTLWGGGTGMLGFALIPVTNYLCVAGGCFLLLIWAFMQGQFSDIERAKYEMLEQDWRYEAMEPTWRAMEREGRDSLAKSAPGETRA